MKTLVLYTKLGCHLCEAAEGVIDSVRGSCAFQFVRRYVTEDPADYERYKHDVPVIVVEGVEVARHRVTRDQLIAALK
jgi:hypothetical protein